MITALLDFVFTLCVLAWLAWLTVAVVLALCTGQLLSRTSVQRIGGWLGRHERRPDSDAQFLRSAGVKR